MGIRCILVICLFLNTGQSVKNVTISVPVQSDQVNWIDSDAVLLANDVARFVLSLSMMLHCIHWYDEKLTSWIDKIVLRKFACVVLWNEIDRSRLGLCVLTVCVTRGCKIGFEHTLAWFYFGMRLVFSYLPTITKGEASVSRMMCCCCCFFLTTAVLCAEAFIANFAFCLVRSIMFVLHVLSIRF